MENYPSQKFGTYARVHKRENDYNIFHIFGFIEKQTVHLTFITFIHRFCILFSTLHKSSSFIPDFSHE